MDGDDVIPAVIENKGGFLFTCKVHLHPLAGGVQALLKLLQIVDVAQHRVQHILCSPAQVHKALLPVDHGSGLNVEGAILIDIVGRAFHINVIGQHKIPGAGDPVKHAAAGHQLFLTVQGNAVAVPDFQQLVQHRLVKGGVKNGIGLYRLILREPVLPLKHLRVTVGVAEPEFMPFLVGQSRRAVGVAVGRDETAGLPFKRCRGRIAGVWHSAHQRRRRLHPVGQAEPARGIGRHAQQAGDHRRQQQRPPQLPAPFPGLLPGVAQQCPGLPHRLRPDALHSLQQREFVQHKPSSLSRAASRFRLRKSRLFTLLLPKPVARPISSM